MPVALLAGSALGAALDAAGPLRFPLRYAAVMSLVVLAALAPVRWARINDGFRLQRDRSIPSYMMAMRARNLARERLGGELYFAGISLPTMVYYSGLRCHFVAPEPSGGVELISDEGGPPRVGPTTWCWWTPTGPRLRSRTTTANGASAYPETLLLIGGVIGV